MKGFKEKVLCIFFITIFMAVLLHKNLYANVPSERVQYIMNKTIEILEDQDLKTPEKEPEKRKLLRELSKDFFDFEEMAKRTLSFHWRKLSAGEKKEFTELFFELLEYTYIGKVKDYNGIEVNFTKEIIEGDFAMVKAKAYTDKNQKILIECRLLNKNGTWNAYDISVEGISLINNYRTQFNSIIRSSSYSNLVKKIKEKINLLKKQ